MLGSVAMNDDYCSALAAELGIVVASVEYRLAPEHPFPAPVEDCYAGLQWVVANAESLGVDSARLAIGGASAGGGLAAGLGLLVRDRAEIDIGFQFLIYPMIDDRNVTESSHAITDPRVWNRAANLAGWNAYLEGQAGTEGVSRYAAAARADDLTGLPSTYLVVGDLDLFVDENVDYANRLRVAGVPVELHVYPGAFHGSNTFVHWSDLSQRWRADEVEALRRALLH